MSEPRVVPSSEVGVEELFKRLGRLTAMIEQESPDSEQAARRLEDLADTLSGWTELINGRVVALEQWPWNSD